MIGFDDTKDIPIEEKIESLRPKVRKLAAEGRLVEETFRLFQRACYPTANENQVTALRIAFFAGAQEVVSLIGIGLSSGDNAEEGDAEFMDNWTEEVHEFHRRTIEALTGETRDN